ncbi:MAG: iron-containing alcohol dehydrogenase [Traorella sp.]
MEIKSISNYQQKPNIIQSLDLFCQSYKNPIFMIDSFVYEKYQHIFQKYSKYPIYFHFEEVKGDCIFGIGGGKMMDEAKYLAYLNQCDCILIPTSPSSDAPCTDLCVINQKYISCGFPRTVLVDEEIIAHAPARLFISGIGDALSTYFEACHYESSVTIEVLSKLCLDTIMTYGKQALDDQKEGLISVPFSKCVEAIFYLSGSVYANTGGSLAHGLASGFSSFCRDVLHGELVAYFLLVQLCIENNAFIHELRDFYQVIGLPIHLNEIGLDEAEDEDFEYILSLCDKKMIAKMPNIVSNENIIEAIRVVDAFM